MKQWEGKDIMVFEKIRNKPKQGEHASRDNRKRAKPVRERSHKREMLECA